MTIATNVYPHTWPYLLNLIRGSNPEVDELSQRIFNTFDVEEHDKLIAQVHEMTDAVRVFIVSDLNPRALSPKLSGFVQAHGWFQDTTPVVFSN